MSYVIDQILKNRTITGYLSKKGIYPVGGITGGKLRFCCPIHKEKHPSFTVYLNGEYEKYFCYGCLDENEEIWTSDGIKAIGDIKVGDRVLDHLGKFSKVLCTQEKTSETIQIVTASNKHGISLTPNHKCLIIKKEDAIKYIPKIYKNKKSTYGYYYQNSALNDERIDNLGIDFTEVCADSVSIGDLIGFPVIPASNRNNKSLGKASNCNHTYRRGPVPLVVNNLPATEKAARLYGFYLAEGSVCSYGRVLRFTFCMDERNTYAKETVKLIKDVFGLNSSISEYPKKNVCEVDCCSVNLIQQIISVFGKGASNKTLPIEVLSWEPSLQKSLLSGYMDGDGNRRKRCVNTVSKNLAISLFAMCIQCGIGPTMSIRSPRIDKHGIHHKASYWLSLKYTNRIFGFFEKINKTVYYLSPILRISKNSKTSRVIDISVKGSETFVTKLGSVHNCKSGVSVIQLYKALENVSTRDAIVALSVGLDLDVNAEIEHIIKEIDEDNKLNGSYNAPSLSLIIARMVNDFLDKVDNNKEDTEAAEKIFELVDEYADKMDLNSLERLANYLPDTLLKKAMMFEVEKEKQYVRPVETVENS